MFRLKKKKELFKKEEIIHNYNIEVEDGKCKQCGANSFNAVLDFDDFGSTALICEACDKLVTEYDPQIDLLLAEIDSDYVQ